ncbi:MAG: SDR family oxidoreductase [Vulcanimicrobiota bacterium]
MIELDGKVALVTGASRGIGRACALKLARAGADVVINYLASPRAAEQVAEEVQQLGRDAVVVKADIGEAEDIEAMLDFVGQRFGRLDILVSNVARGGFHSLRSITPEQFKTTMNVNAMALVSLVQAALPWMQAGSGRPKVVSLSSHGARKAIENYGMIGASKAALESLTRHLALEFPQINFNVVLAGLVRTQSTKALPEALFETVDQHLLTAGRKLTCDDVADSVLFLSSPLADLIQGQTLVVDGGISLL